MTHYILHTTYEVYVCIYAYIANIYVAHISYQCKQQAYAYFIRSMKYVHIIRCAVACLRHDVTDGFDS